MGTLVLVRHGESRWNLYNRFTGWVDVPLSVNGIREAEACSKHCRQFDFDAAFTSKLQRAQSTAMIILSRQNRTGIFQHEEEGPYYRWSCDSNTCLPDDIPIYETEALNERYYGILQGMDKKKAERKYGLGKLLAWRRGYESRPPKGECLKDVFQRVHPYFLKHILPRIRKGETIMLASHGNTLRSIIMFLEGLSAEDVTFVDLPKAKPLVYEFRRGKFKRTAGDYRLDRPLR